MASLRIHEIARQLGVTSKDVLAAAKLAKVPAKTASSTVTEYEADILRGRIHRQARADLTPPPGRPAGMPRPIPAAAAGGDGRPVRVDQLASMERAILPQHLYGRRMISATDAAGLRADARRWAEAGFDAKAVRPWNDQGISPRDAGYLRQRGVPASVLDLPIPIGLRGDARMTVAEALTTTGWEWPVERVYALLLETGWHTPSDEPELVLPEPTAVAPRTNVASVVPVIFSNPAGEGQGPTDSRPPRHHDGGRGPRRGR